jgi:recombination protein RecT
MATNAVATREEGAVARQSDNPLVRFRSQLEQRTNEFKMALPSHIKPDQFQRTIVTAVQADPEMLNADRQSLILACMKAAQDGLLPDKREAALVVYKENKNVNGQWIERKVVQYLPMVYGLRKKILQSREVTDIKPNIVYRREVEEGHFIYEEGTEAVLRHKPILDLTEEQAADSNIVVAYSIATYKDGSKSYEVMRRFEVDKVRECSQTGATKDKKGRPRTPKGPWVDWFPEQAKKTVMRRHSKTLPQSGDLVGMRDVEADDEAIYAASTAQALDHEPDAPRALPPTREDIAIAEGADPATGEIARDEEDEESARALDRQSEAAMERRDDEGEGPSDEQRGESHNDTDTSAADDLIARIGAAAIIGDVIGIESSYQSGGREMFETLDQDRIETAIAEAKARLKGGK